MKIIPMNTDARSIVDMIYPIGSYYWSSNATNPSSIFGGAWEQVKDRFVLAAGDTYAAGSTGGEASHTLSIDEMPWHDHDLRNVLVNSLNGTQVNVGSGGGIISFSSVEGINKTNATGRSQPHNNMPPYIVAYCWHRTA